jgi:hypothetical protein
MTINKFFDIVVCLTQKKRFDRQMVFQDECERNGIISDIFYSIDDNNPHISFCKSQIAMLREFLETGKETLLTLEDDVQFRDLDKFEQVTKELPEDWTMFYLGANAKPYAEFTPAEYYSEHLRIIRSAFCTHAVGYKRSLVAEIVEKYERIDGQLFDTWLDIYILRTRDVYISVPMLAVQRPVRSDLWGTVVDYTDIWTGSNDYLKSIR